MWKEKTASGILNTVRVCVTKQNDTIFDNPFFYYTSLLSIV